jgi:mycothiol synthase
LDRTADFGLEYTSLMDFSISSAAPHELLPALRLLFPVEPRLPDLRIDTSGLFVVRDASGAIRGAIMGQSMPGALGLAWAPCAELDELADKLVVTVCVWLRRRGVKVCQAFSTTGEMRLMAPLARHSFRKATQLVTLRCAIGGEVIPNSLTFESISPPFTAPCRAMFLSTHEGTLDCPELNFGRAPEELLAEFIEMGLDTTWHVARRDELPVGVAILTTGVAEREVELAYLGVAPGFRGRGLGRELLEFARSEAARRGASSLAVSVDERNWPALKLYRRNGFYETNQREVWLAHFF